MNDETTSPDLGLLVDWTRNGSSQTGALTIRAAGEVLLADDGKITRQDFRDRATKTMFDVADERGIDLSKLVLPNDESCNRASFEAWFRGYATERTTTPEAVEPKRRRLPASSVVRGGQFFSEHVSGLTNPHIVLTDGAPCVEYDLVLQWANGRRQVTPFVLVLDLPGGGTLHLHPEPIASDPTTCQSQWTDAHVDEWVGGETPDAAEVYRRLLKFVHAMVWFDDTRRNGAAATVALFVMMTYIAPLFDAVPYLWANGPKNSGKTELLKVLLHLAFRAVKSSNMSGAVLFRTLHAGGGTFLCDEMERSKMSGIGDRSNDVRDVLLSGYKQGSPAMRCEGEDHKVVSYNVYGPKGLASISQLQDALVSRCIRIQMLRATEDMTGQNRSAGARRLRDDLHALMLGNVFEIADAADSMTIPTTITNRDAELWKPLLAVAYWLESHGVSDVVERCESFAESTISEAADIAVDECDEAILYTLLRRVEGGMGDCIAKDLLDELKREDEETWKRWKAAGVAARLRSYGIRCKPTGGRRTYRWVTAEQIRKRMAAYGILSADTPSVALQPAQPAQDPPSEPRSGDSGVPVSCAGADRCAGSSAGVCDSVPVSPADENGCGATENGDSVPVVPVVPVADSGAGPLFTEGGDEPRERVEL